MPWTEDVFVDGGSFKVVTGGSPDPAYVQLEGGIFVYVLPTGQDINALATGNVIDFNLGTVVTNEGFTVPTSTTIAIPTDNFWDVSFALNFTGVSTRYTPRAELLINGATTATGGMATYQGYSRNATGAEEAGMVWPPTPLKLAATDTVSISVDRSGSDNTGAVTILDGSFIIIRST